jgi:hypothetical protein
MTKIKLPEELLSRFDDLCKKEVSMTKAMADCIEANNSDTYNLDMTLSDVIQTAIDGNIDRLRVSMLLADLTREAITKGYIMPGGEPTVRGKEYIKDNK